MKHNFKKPAYPVYRDRLGA